MGSKSAIFALLVCFILFSPSALANEQEEAFPITIGSSVPVQSMEVIASHTDRLVFSVGEQNARARLVTLAEGRFLQLDRTTGANTEVGSPALPIDHCLVDVPYGAQHFAVRILDQEWTEYNLQELGNADHIMPVQPALTKSADADQVVALALDRNRYKLDSYYPQATVSLHQAGILRGHRLLGVTLNPMQYNPARKTLRVLNAARFEITFQGGNLDTTQQVHQRYSSGPFNQILENTTANHGFMSTDYEPHPSLPVGYLIITHTTFAAAIQPLADWKEHIGYETTVVTTAVTGGTTTAIKDYIQNAYNTWPVPPSFILLVGDSNQIPGFTGPASGTITDLPYTLMDGGDYFADIHIGRFSVANTTQLQNVLDKTLGYEQVDWAYTAWIKKAVFMASVDNSNISEGTHNYVIDNYLDPNGYTCDKLYQVTYGADTQDVRDSVNDGRSLAIFSGHGSETSWADGPPFSQNDVNNLTNSDMFPFVCSHACLTGNFAIGECFGETWQRADGKGGLAFWGGSNSTYWDEDDVLEKAVWERAFVDDLYYLNGMTSQGLIDLYNHYGGSGYSQYYFECYNILGDPSIYVHTEEPVLPAVTHNTALPIGAAQLNVSVTLGGAPMANAMVHVAKDTEVFESVYTDAAGQAVLNLSTATPGMMNLVITGHNAIPFEGSVTIFVPSGPYVVLSDSSVDDSLGDNDGLIDIGEYIGLPVAGENVGTVNSPGVVATLSCLDPMVTIIDDTEILGDIGPGAIVWSPDDFNFSVNPQCPDGHMVAFTVTFTDTDTNTWDYTLNLLVNAPKTVYDSYTLDDSTGNNDGIADPGEDITFDVVLFNSGHETARTVTVNLHTLDAYCTITQGSAAYPDLAPLGAGSNLGALSAQIAAGCPVGHEVLINVDIYRNALPVGSDQFSFIVSKIPVLLVDLDTNHNSAPALESAFASLGISYDKVTAWPTDTSVYQSLFVCLGIFSEDTELSTNQANELVAFMQNGGHVYMEGGECFYYDSVSSIYDPYFGINGDADGTSDTGTIQGQAGTLADGLTYTYTGDNDYMDHISAATGADLIFRNQSPSYGNGVSFDAGTYRSLGVTFEFGGLKDGVNGSKLDWMMAIADFFELPQEIQPLFASSNTLSARTGGTINFTLNAEADNGNRYYVMLGSMSGSMPGIPLPNGGETLPVHWDTFTDYVLSHLNTAVFTNFLGVLDAQGYATASLNTGPLNPSKIGTVMTFAYCLEGTPDWDFVSNPVNVEVTN